MKVKSCPQSLHVSCISPAIGPLVGIVQPNRRIAYKESFELKNLHRHSSFLAVQRLCSIAIITLAPDSTPIPLIFSNPPPGAAARHLIRTARVAYRMRSRQHAAGTLGFGNWEPAQTEIRVIAADFRVTIWLGLHSKVAYDRFCGTGNLPVPPSLTRGDLPPNPIYEVK